METIILLLQVILLSEGKKSNHKVILQYMKEKIVQDFANVCGQMFLTSRCNYDRINMVLFGSGTLKIDFLNLKCEHNNIAVSPYFYTEAYLNWLTDQCSKSNFDFESLTKAELEVVYEIEEYRKGSLNWLCAKVKMECVSKFEVDGNLYESRIAEDQECGLGQIIPGKNY